jgi:tryptophan halogenase
MMGQGLQPKSHHLGSKVLQTQQLKQQLDTFRQMINSAVAKMPEHADFVKQYCPVSSTN